MRGRRAPPPPRGARPAPRSPLRVEHTLARAAAAAGADRPRARRSVNKALPLAPLAAAAAECFCSAFCWQERVTQVKAEKGGLFL